jgi:hypothetical protein
MQPYIRVSHPESIHCASVICTKQDLDTCCTRDAQVLAPTPAPAPPAIDHHLDTGHTAFMFMSMGLVQFMTPGLAFFYGGLVCKRNVVTMMMQNFISMAIMTLLWFIRSTSSLKEIAMIANATQVLAKRFL